MATTQYDDSYFDPNRTSEGPGGFTGSSPTTTDVASQPDSTFNYDPTTNRSTGVPTTDEQWQQAMNSQYNQGTELYGAPAGSGWLDNVGTTLAEGTSMTQGVADQFLREALANGVPQDYIDSFLASNPNDYHRIYTSYNSGQTGSGPDSGSIDWTQGTPGISQPGGGQTPPISPYGTPSRTLPAQFTDPITGPIEAAAQLRAQQLENPASNSGQALFEQALRSIAQQFQNGGYTPAEQELLTTQVMDPLEQARSARKQEVLQNLSARGIPQTSGVAIQMLNDVDRQFDAMRQSSQRGLGADIAQERTNRMLQAIQLLSGLAGTENSRLDQAFQYRTTPLNLADRAFNQAMQVYQGAGNPLQLVNSLAGLANTQYAQNSATQEALGYLAYLLANGGGA